MHGCNFWGQSSGLLGLGFFAHWLFCTCESHCAKYMIVPLLDNLHLVFLWHCGSPGPSGCAYAAKTAHEARFSSSLHYLPAKASSRPAQGWISWHTFERKASSDAPHLSVHRGQALTHCKCQAQARLVFYLPSVPCHILKVGKKASWNKRVLFCATRAMWTGETCEQGKQVLGKLLPSKCCWFWQPGHESAHDILKILEGNSLDWCCYCKVTLTWHD